jgi:hypothetical protein
VWWPESDRPAKPLEAYEARVLMAAADVSRVRAAPMWRRVAQVPIPSAGVRTSILKFPPTSGTRGPVLPLTSRRPDFCEHTLMPCLLLLLVLAFPRFMLVLMFFFSNYLQRAYNGILIPLLGFIFLPLTTIVYAWMVNNNHVIDGINLLIIIVAVIIDLGGLGGGEWHRRRR